MSAKRKKPFNSLVGERYDFCDGHPGVISDGISIGRDGRLSGRSELTRNFDEELDYLECRVDKSLRQLGYPKTLMTAGMDSHVGLLFGIKRTIYYIRQHRAQGRDIAALAFDLGAQVRDAHRVGFLAYEETGRKIHESARKGAIARHGSPTVVEERHSDWQLELDSLHEKNKLRSWTALSDRVGKNFGVSGKTVRDACVNPHTKK